MLQSSPLGNAIMVHSSPDVVVVSSRPKFRRMTRDEAADGPRVGREDLGQASFYRPGGY